MKKVYALLGCCLLSAQLFAQAPKSTIAIIPEPVSLTPKPGVFVFPKTVTLSVPVGAENAQAISFLRNHFADAAGVKLIVKQSPLATIKLTLNKTDDAQLGAEGYKLTVTKKGVVIKANKPAGLFYGVQTLAQLLPKQFESATLVKGISWTAPCVDITDYPRFAWRGLMLDVSRHFFTKQEVETYIDHMARYKFNLIHMHLVDDEGWRVEIKSLPRLTEVASHNAKRVGYFGTFKPIPDNEPRTYGGFYTQDDIRELVQYAKDRFMNILPEIDVPGHSLAAIVAYPELSATAGADKYMVRSGESMQGIDNTLNPSSEKTYQFLDKVVTEVAQLFPFGYIHMGGDECNKEFWAKSDSVKALMTRENLKTYEEVQSYFEKRVEKIVESKGKKFMGWDEILEGGLAPNAAVMSWRSMKGGIEAAKMGHEVVMSPVGYAYLDYMNGDPVMEPRVYETLRLSKTYSFEPVPDSVDSKLVIGGQANLWTEQVMNTRHLEYMTWPRAWAISETMWSPKIKKNWDYFFDRVEHHFARFDEAKIKYAPSVYDPIINPSITPDSTLQIALGTEVKGLEIHYSFDNSFPDEFYPTYTAPLIVPKDAVMLKAITYRDGKPIGRMMFIPMDAMWRRLGKKMK